MQGDDMINYDVLWETMREKNISQYVLINRYNVSRGLIHRLKNNESVTTNSIDMLCEILDCDVQDVMTYSREKKD